LTRAVGKHYDLALYELTESLLAGRLQMHVEHFVAGELKGNGIVRPSWWRSELALEIVEGRVVVLPLKAFVPGEFKYTLREFDVRLLWPPGGAEPVRDVAGYQAQRAQEVLKGKWPPCGAPPVGMSYKEVHGVVDEGCAVDNKNRGLRTPSPDVVTRLVKANRKAAANAARR
jgi:hypothetical protein